MTLKVSGAASQYPRSALCYLLKQKLAASSQERTSVSVYSPPTSTIALLSQHPRSVLCHHLKQMLATARHKRTSLSGQPLYGLSGSANKGSNLHPSVDFY